MSYKITSQIKSSIIIAMFALGFVACQDHKNDDSKKVDNHILGLASPIRLKFDSTTVYLTDYFPEKSGFEKIEWNGKTWTADSAGILLLTGKAQCTAC